MGRRDTASSSIAAVTCLLAAAIGWAAGPPSRIPGRVEGVRTFVLSGNTHPLIESAADQGEVEGTFPLPRITIHFQMTPAQRADLDRLLEALQDRSGPQYHKWLTPEQYAERFGVSGSDLEALTAWLERMGFTDVEPARSRTFVSMSGTAAAVRYAFGAAIHRYRVAGTVRYANAGAPALPRELEGVIGGIRGLNDFRPRPHARLRPRLTSSVTGNHFMAPGDFATIYNVWALYSGGLDGTGQRIAVVGQSAIQLSDIAAFQTASGLPVKNPQIVVTGPAPGSNAGDAEETDLDIEWAGAVARGATIVLVEAQDAFTAATYAIDNNVAPVLSITYGACEVALAPSDINSLNSLFQLANAQGITVVAASGDSGASDCDTTSPTHGLAVDFPASSPYVTGVGGTEFQEGAGAYWSSTNGANGGSALSYIPEAAWNDSGAGVLSATGGGASGVFTKPPWQQGTGVPGDGFRDVPDIALNASPNHDGYVICSGGSCTNGFRGASGSFDVMGGTSCGAPTFAGIVALINQETGSSQGNVNPTLYSLASISTDAFHDVTMGNNQAPCAAGSPGCNGTQGYTAGPGYDQTTGLGSVNAQNLVTEWGSDFQVSVSPASLTVAAGGSATADVQITRFANFTGAVSFTCSVPAALANTTCSIPGTVSGGAGSAALTVTRSSAAGGARWFPPGPALPWCAAVLSATLAGLVVIRRRRARLVWAGAVALSLALIAGCGKGSGSGTGPSGPLTANVTVTAACGVLKHAVTIAVTEP